MTGTRFTISYAPQRHYDWADLQRLLRTADRVEPEELITTVERRFEVLRQLTELEQSVIADARRARSPGLAERLQAEIRQRAGVKPSTA